MKKLSKLHAINLILGCGLGRCSSNKRKRRFKIANCGDMLPQSVDLHATRNTELGCFVVTLSRTGKGARQDQHEASMFKPALLLAAGAAVLATSPADARYWHHRHHYYYRHHYYSYYSPYRYSYAYPAYSYSYPVYYSYPAYPSYYAYPAYSYPSYSISIGLGGGYHHYRRW